MSFDVYTFRRQFPILGSRNNFGKALIYFDNAATMQVPECVDAIVHRPIKNGFLFPSSIDSVDLSELSNHNQNCSHVELFEIRVLLWKSGREIKILQTWSYLKFKIANDDQIGYH
jgi:hypothetical protein